VTTTPPCSAGIRAQQALAAGTRITATDVHRCAPAGYREHWYGTCYGLGGSVWTQDFDRAYDIARRIKTGTVWGEPPPAPAPKVPVRGSKQSGIGGVDYGVEGLKGCTQPTVIRILKKAPESTKLA
jgi:aldehyde dehydrogenase family protein